MAVGSRRDVDQTNGLRVHQRHGQRIYLTTWEKVAGATSRRLVAALDGAPPAADCDVTPPTVTAPRRGFVYPSAVSSEGLIRLRVPWTASDVGTGIAHQELAQSVDGGAWKSLSSTLGTSEMTPQVPPDHTSAFRARAVDFGGNFYQLGNARTDHHHQPLPGDVAADLLYGHVVDSLRIEFPRLDSIYDGSRRQGEPDVHGPRRRVGRPVWGRIEAPRRSTSTAFSSRRSTSMMRRIDTGESSGTTWTGPAEPQGLDQGRRHGRATTRRPRRAVHRELRDPLESARAAVGASETR